MDADADAESDYHGQVRGIRQGCPLSPYLSLIMMTAMFKAVYRDHECRIAAAMVKMPALDFAELLYADDTLLMTYDKISMDKIVH